MTCVHAIPLFDPHFGRYVLHVTWLNHDGPDASLRFTTVRQTPRGGSSLLVRCRRHHAHSLFFCDSMKVSRAEAGESLAPVRGRFTSI